MRKSKCLPRRFYKYREFNDNTLDMLVSDKVFYADPSTFNDPLDSRPSVRGDLSEDALENTLRTLIERRIRAEMTAAAKTIKYKGPKTITHIERHSRQRADSCIKKIRQFIEYEDPDIIVQADHLLRTEIEEELLLRYDKGIVSLAGQETCPLMWSHYGDQHRGICIGYSLPDDATVDIHKVKYGGSRRVKASDVAAMLQDDDAAQREVDGAVLLRKANSWSYEQEWRLIGPLGLQDSPFVLELVIFGMRCKDSTKYVVMKALENREKSVKFYNMRTIAGTFDLKPSELGYDNLLFESFPRCCQPVVEDFDALSSD